jgi:SAM-dependent methyltransferase
MRNRPPTRVLFGGAASTEEAPMALRDVATPTDDVWGEAPYERFSGQHAGAIEHLLRLLPSGPGVRWLDVGTGTGEVALPAAVQGAAVTGCDLSPGMIATARRRAAEAGLDISYDVADAQALPYPDASFDVVTSCFTINLVPDHAVAARELARVCRPGGTLGLVTVLPDRGQAEVFGVLLRYLPPLPEDAPDPYAWADRDYLHRLLGDAFELAFADGDAPQGGASGAAMWDLMASAYGPAHHLLASLDPDSRAELSRGVVAVYEGYRTPAGDISMPRPYLVVTGTRR